MYWIGKNADVITFIMQLEDSLLLDKSLGIICLLSVDITLYNRGNSLAAINITDLCYKCVCCAPLGRYCMAIFLK